MTKKKPEGQTRNVKFVGLSILAEDEKLLSEAAAMIEAEKGVPVAKARVVGIVLRDYLDRQKRAKR